PARAAAQVTQCETALVVVLSAHRTRRVHRRDELSQAAEYVLPRRTVNVAAVTATDLTVFEVRDQAVGVTVTAAAFEDPRRFAARRPRTCQSLLAYQFPARRSPAFVDGAVAREFDSEHVARDACGHGAARHVLGHGNGLASERVAVSAARLPAVVPHVAARHRRALVLAGEDLEPSVDVLERRRQGRARIDAPGDVRVDHQGDTDRRPGHASAQADGMWHFGPGAGEQPLEIVVGGAVHGVGEFTRAAAAVAPRAPGVL